MKKNNANTLIIELRNQDIHCHLINQQGILHESHLQPISTRQHTLFGSYYDPHEILYAIRTCVNSLLHQGTKTTPNIQSIGIISHMHCFVCCDAQTGLSLTPAISMIESNITDFYTRINRTSILQDYYEETQCVTRKDSLLMHLHWLLNDKTAPIPQSKHMIVASIESFILMNLTGLETFATDTTCAQVSGLYSHEKQQWSPIILKDLSLTPKSLPIIQHSFSYFGKTKSFIPLADDIPIHAIIHHQSLQWLHHNSSEYGDTHIFIDHNHISITQNHGIETPLIKSPFTKQTLHNQQTSIHMIQHDITTPEWPKSMIKESLQHVIQHSSPSHTWPPSLLMTSNQAANKQGHTLSIIGLSHQHPPIQLALGYLECCFHLIKQELHFIEDQLDLLSRHVFVSSTLNIPMHLWEPLANILQHPLHISNPTPSQSLACSLHIQESPSDKFKKTLTKTLKEHVTTYYPTQDPISSFARYNQWQSIQQAAIIPT